MIFKRTLFTLADTTIVNQIKELSKECYYLEHNGKIYNNLEEIGENKLIQLHFRVLGGKGGFGSLLRSFRIHKSTNQLMCRNLSGRRLADVKEEERLQRWIEKKEEREKAKEQKRQEKIDRLKRGHPKHEFTDQNYLQKRELILDQTEDAIEAGLENLKNNTSNLNEDFLNTSSTSSSSNDSDFDIYDDIKLPSTSIINSRKRKANGKSNSSISKKLKVEYTSEVIFNYFTEIIIEEVAQLAIIEAQNAKRKAEKEKILSSNQNLEDVKKKKKKVLEIKPSTEFPNIDLNDYKSSEELEKLGLDCLKHALQMRNLKCGGSIKERAIRLYSVKNLRDDKIPNNLKAKK